MTKVKLVRLNDRMIGGVCAGFARYLNIKPIYLRLLFVLFCFFGGTAILVYLLCWIIIPNELKELATYCITGISTVETRLSAKARLTFDWCLMVKNFTEPMNGGKQMNEDVNLSCALQRIL